MLPDRVSNPGPLTYESGALPIALRGPAGCIERVVYHCHENQKFYLVKIAINEKCQKPKLTVKAIMVVMATAG